MGVSPLRYPGGKSRAVKRILAHVPTRIREYREPFVGGGSVLFAIKALFGARIESYWVNDLNSDLVYFWQFARDETEALVARVREVKAEYVSGRALYAAYSDDRREYTPLERAVRFFIMNRITFSGIVDSGGYSQQSYDLRFTDSSIRRVSALAQPLCGVQITCGDYEEVVGQAGEGVFIFLDPPYLSATKSRLYGVDGKLHSTFDHERFARVMRACPHHWLLTYDNSPEIRRLFHFAHISDWELQYAMNNFKQDHADIGKELFISNYALEP